MVKVKTPVVMLCCFITAALTFSRTPQKNPLDGVWLSDGYGYMIEFSGDTMHLSEITSISCIPAMTGKRQSGSSKGDIFALEGSSRQFEIVSGPSDNEKQIHNPGAASNIVIRRVAQKPEACRQETPNTPESNFEVFWATFNAHHAFLKERGADWAATYKKYRPRVTASTTPDELFRIFSEMIEPLHDAHTSVRGEGPQQRFNGRRPDPDRLSSEDQQKTLEIIKSKYAHGELRSWCNNRVQYGRLNDSTGYLRISAFSGYTTGGGYEEGAEELAKALDAMVEDCRGLGALVIDVRLNGGGSDPYGVAVAGRLTDDKYVAFVKRARDDSKDPTRFTRPQTTWVLPAPGPRFTGRVIELIGRDTVSAGETFSMALMGRKPAVIRIGEPTQGVYSDVLGRTLPNGWRFGLPNEVFLNERGRHFEVVGVPPDITVPVFPREDLQAGRDTALGKALEIAAQNKRNDAGSAGAADIVFRNARILTMNDAQPSATAIALKGERIAAVGSPAEMTPLIGPATRVYDLGGRTIIPGINESHIHVRDLGSRSTAHISLTTNGSAALWSRASLPTLSSWTPTWPRCPTRSCSRCSRGCS